MATISTQRTVSGCFETTDERGGSAIGAQEAYRGVRGNVSSKVSRSPALLETAHQFLTQLHWQGGAEG